eukprot:SAG11_NODE_1772_length_4273_cov_3.739578_5_plen_289_part_00
MFSLMQYAEAEKDADPATYKKVATVMKNYFLCQKKMMAITPIAGWAAARWIDMVCKASARRARQLAPLLLISSLHLLSSPHLLPSSRAGWCPRQALSVAWVIDQPSIATAAEVAELLELGTLLHSQVCRARRPASTPAHRRSSLKIGALPRSATRHRAQTGTSEFRRPLPEVSPPAAAAVQEALGTAGGRPRRASLTTRRRPARRWFEFKGPGGRGTGNAGGHNVNNAQGLKSSAVWYLFSGNQSMKVLPPLSTIHYPLSTLHSPHTLLYMYTCVCIYIAAALAPPAP